MISGPEPHLRVYNLWRTILKSIESGQSRGENRHTHCKRWGLEVAFLPLKIALRKCRKSVPEGQEWCFCCNQRHRQCRLTDLPIFGLSLPKAGWLGRLGQANVTFRNSTIAASLLATHAIIPVNEFMGTCDARKSRMRPAPECALAKSVAESDHFSASSCSG